MPAGDRAADTPTPTSDGEAAAAPSSAAGGIADIVVTATKRSESLSRVPISITAVSGDELAARGIASLADLTKAVSGFTFVQAVYGPPVFTLRGIGFYDSSIGSKPSVSVYLDEVPIPFSIETKGAALDLERVEVLKGPQGTLFGANATGGAVNYIAAKPTDTFKAGFNSGFGSYNSFDGSAYISGPITDTISARLAVSTQQGGAYQRSITRPNDRLGDRDFTAGRLTVDFKPSPTLKFELGLNGYLDSDQPVAPQYIALRPQTTVPANSLLPFAPFAAPNDKSADWTHGVPRSNNRFYQASLRGDWQFAKDFTLTSLTSYSHFDPDYGFDVDGLALNDLSFHTTGSLETFSQELRVAGNITDRLKFIVGGNYELDRAFQNDIIMIPQSTSAQEFAALGVPLFTGLGEFGRQRYDNKAVFGNVDYDLGEHFALHGGVRYTRTDINFSGCAYDIDGALATGLTRLLDFVLRPEFGVPGTTTIPPGGCTTVDPTPGPVFLTSHLVVNQLDQGNVSWRGGLDYKPSSRLLIYGSVSRGYKSGSFPVVAASSATQFNPVKQESVTAYEVGAKLNTADRRLQVSAAAFFYDYRDKQFQDQSLATPNIFGPLPRLTNVPRSRIAGGEIQADIAPFAGLKLTLAGTYLSSLIEGPYIDSDPFGNFSDHGGEPFQFTPEFQAQGDGQYDWRLSDRFGAFAGGDVQYRSSTNTAFGRDPLFDIRAYTLVGLRAGVLVGPKVRFTAFVRNLLDTYYWTNAARGTDTIVRFAGRPRTIGGSVGVQF